MQSANLTVADNDPRALSVIVPAWNERRAIDACVRTVLAWLDAAGRRGEIILVDDGSRDDTSEVAIAAAGGDPRYRSIRFERNFGKGRAVRTGMLAATHALRLMTDVDLSTPLDEFPKLEAAIADGAEVAIASRDMPDSRLTPPQPWLRRIGAWTFRAVRRRLLLSGIRDTQCGFKLFTATAAEAVFSLAQEDGWFFDCEALALADALGLRVREVGVRWRNDPDSRVRALPTAFAAIPALLRIRRSTRRCAARRSAPTPADPEAR